MGYHMGSKSLRMLKRLKNWYVQCVCVCVRERERCGYSVYLCVCVCVCERERERISNLMLCSPFSQCSCIRERDVCAVCVWERERATDLIMREVLWASAATMQRKSIYGFVPCVCHGLHGFLFPSKPDCNPNLQMVRERERASRPVWVTPAINYKVN